MQAPYSHAPALPAAIGLMAGIAAAPCLAQNWLWALGACCVICGVGVWVYARFFALCPLAFAIGLALVAVAPESNQSEPVAARNALAESIYSSPMQGATAAFAATTMLADKQYLARDVRDNFRSSGVAHVLALSGFHVGIVAMAAMWLTLPLALLGRFGRVRYLLVLAAVWGFAAIGGMSPSLMRAAIMCTMLLGSRVLERHSLPMNSLAVAAIIILLFNPMALFDVGFQLSFISVAGIIVAADVLNPYHPRYRHRMHRLFQFPAVTIAASLATAPLVAWYFGRLPVAFVLTNIVVLVLFTPFYVCAFLVAVLNAAGLPCAAIATAADKLYALMTESASALSFDVAAAPGFGGMLACYAVIGVAVGWLRVARSRREI